MAANVMEIDVYKRQPSDSLRPTMPPTSLSPVTTPVNWQLMRVPWLMPTMPPVVVSAESELSLIHI